VSNYQKKTQVREINAKWSWRTNENQIRTSEGEGNGHKTKTDSVGFEPEANFGERWVWISRDLQRFKKF
jgi:hypothetical protein